MPHLLIATPRTKEVALLTAQGHARATRILLCELIDEVCVDAAERAKLERKQVARRYLRSLLLLHAIWEKQKGGRLQGASARCASVRGTFAVVQTPCAPTG